MDSINYDEKSLLAKADEFCALTKRARSGVANEILNDSKFFDRLESGATCTVRTFKKVSDWFAENMPQTKPATKRNSNSAQANT